jgi:hypothetical protein
MLQAAKCGVTGIPLLPSEHYGNEQLDGITAFYQQLADLTPHARDSVTLVRICDYYVSRPSASTPKAINVLFCKSSIIRKAIIY